MNYWAHKRPKLWRSGFEPSERLIALPTFPIVDLHPWLWNLQLAWCLQVEHSLMWMNKSENTILAIWGKRLLAPP